MKNTSDNDFPVLKSKLPNTGTTIFTVMSQLANEVDAINLSQGFPDFDCSKRLFSLVNAAMRNGFNQYSPMAGNPKLLESIARKVENIYAVNLDPATQITVTPGATAAIYTAITAVVREGDEVIVFTPAYDCYVPAIELCGGVPIFIEMTYPEYDIDWEKVKKLVNNRTRMIIINTPHNPSGTVLSKADMDQLAQITDGSDIVILSDEVYEHIIFDGLQHESILRHPKLFDRSFVVFSFGKTFHATGWKMGYCLAPKPLMEEFKRVHQFVNFSCNTPVQVGLAEFMEEEDEYLGLMDFYQQKRDFFLEGLKQTRFKLLPSSGTYFQVVSYAHITDEADTEYAIRLTKEFGVASIPVSVFYHRKLDDKVLRFCFAKKESTLKKALTKLCKI